MWFESSKCKSECLEMLDASFAVTTQLLYTISPLREHDTNDRVGGCLSSHNRMHSASAGHFARITMSYRDSWSFAMSVL